MSTGRTWRAAAIAVAMGLAGLFTGCGGGDSGNNGSVAPAALEGRSYDFSPNTGGQTAVSFTSPTAYTFQHEDGAVEQGTYDAQRDGNAWSVKLINLSGGQQLYIMTFGSENGGTFVLKRDGEEDRFGPFTARSTAVPSGDVNNTTTSGTTTGTTTGTDSGGSTTTSNGASTDGTTTGTTSGSTTDGTTTSGGGTTSGNTTTGGVTPSTQYTGFSPVSVAGRTMFGTRTFTSTGPSGQTHTYTFGNGTFHDSDAPEEADGTYTYSANHGTATLNLNYTAPSTFAGEKHQINMTFTEKDRGNFTSIYTRNDGTEITINGTFDFQPIQ